MLYQYYPMKKNKGITCASAGNHAQGVAYTAKAQFKGCYFHASNYTTAKINQVKFFGDNNVEIILIGDTFDHCLAQALNYTKQHKMNFIDPFNNVYTIAGQGTIAKEILNQAEKEDNTFDYVFAAIGGGGLISGVSTYFKTHSPH